MTIARLMIADSEHDADMLYVSGMFVPDPFIAIGIDDQWHGLFSPLEVDRARKQSGFNAIHLDSEWRKKSEQSGYDATLVGAAAAFLADRKIKQLQVPGHFPLSYANQLTGWGFEVQCNPGSLFPERAVKRETEIRQLARAEKLTRRAMQQAERYLADCGIGNDGILTAAENGKRVKSADVRRAIETFLIGEGAMPAHTIVACGREAADPHNVGHGFIRSGQPIIVDIFPRLLDTGYWGDMTRTYVKGKADAGIKKLYNTVKAGQKIGLSMVASGVDGLRIHSAITDYFTRQGFVTGMRRGKQVGFFHGTGHGVGLNIHESPRISSRSDILRAGQVVTVEPGLYYPNLGGVRLEDMVVVRDQGCDNLTLHPCRLEIA